MIRRVGFRVLQLLVLVSVLSLVAGHIAGQPILLSFVETGSMEPTIDAGDGFVAIPSAFTDDPDVGDIVVFDAEEIGGGELTTHRIVDETDGGYVTQGDANPTTDQAGGEPPVQNAQIVASALTIGGTTVTIPHLGTAIMGLADGLESIQHWLAFSLGLNLLLGPAGLAWAVLVLSVALYTFETVRERRQRTFSSRLGVGDDGLSIDMRHLCLGFAVLVAFAGASAMVVPTDSHAYGVVSAEFESDRPLVIETGTTEEIPYVVQNNGFVPIVSYIEPASDGVTVEPERVELGPRSDTETTVSITAPDDTGYYPTYVTEYRYLAILPSSVLDVLYVFHPWVPIVTIVFLLGGGTYAVGRLLLGSGDAKARRKSKRRSYDLRRGRGRRH